MDKRFMLRGSGAENEKRMQSGRRRIGIYGGTFDPPHLGHISAAADFLKQCCLDMLYVMPVNIPPHKAAASAEPAQRLEMLRLIFSEAADSASDGRICVSDFEMCQPGKSYTVITLRHFRKEGELFLLVGTDMFMTLDTWYLAQEIFRLATIVYVRRGSGECEAELAERGRFYERTYAAKVLPLRHVPFEVSSTEIRELLTDGKDTSAYLPASVAEYIKIHGLYNV